jgi:hypothetical protein
LVIGDSTTGKSETTKWCIRLLDGGQLVVAEMASMVGLSATTTQAGNGSWFVEWGPLVLGDRRLLAIDGAQRLSRQEWSTLAEAQRLGTIKITKAARGEAHARTRQLLIANPVDFERKGTKEMDGFLYPYQTLPTILDAVNIARLDLAIFVNANDVSIEDLNTVIRSDYDNALHCLSDLRAFVWQGRYETTYGEGFVESIHRHATDLYNKYHLNDVPLLSIDLKFKLVRLSTALALATCSFDDKFTVVNVTKEHVDYIAKFLDDVYAKAGFGEGADDDRAGQVEPEQVDGIVQSIANNIGFDMTKVRDILLWVGQQSAPFTKDQIKEKFKLADKAELRPLLSLLQDEQIIKRGSGFYPTPRGVQLARLLIEKDCHDCHDRPP